MWKKMMKINKIIIFHFNCFPLLMQYSKNQRNLDLRNFCFSRINYHHLDRWFDIDWLMLYILMLILMRGWYGVAWCVCVIKEHWSTIWSFIMKNVWNFFRYFNLDLDRNLICHWTIVFLVSFHLWPISVNCVCVCA